MIDVSKIKRNTGQTEASVYMTGNLTNRSLDPNSTQNVAIDFTPEQWDLAKIKAVFDELLIRFDTAPLFYTKLDYEHLIRMIGNGFYSLITGQSSIEIDTDWSNPTDEKVPSTLLVYGVKEAADKLEAYVKLEIAKLNTDISSIKSTMASQDDLKTLEQAITVAYMQVIKQLREDLENEFDQKLDNKADRSHTHIAADINDFDSKVLEIIDSQVWWADITD